MKGGYHSVETLWVHLDEIGALEPFLAVLVAGGLLMFGMSKYRWFKSRGGLEGIRVRGQLKKLRAKGQLEGEFTFADAVELTQTGTIRAKTLEDKILDCVVNAGILFGDEEHHLVYQLEMEYRSEKEVTGWVEATRALRLPDIELIFEEVVLIRRILCNPCRELEDKAGVGSIYEKLNRRAVELNEKIANIDGIAQLRSAGEFHLRKHAPHLLPLPPPPIR